MFFVSILMLENQNKHIWVIICTIVHTWTYVKYGVLFTQQTKQTKQTRRCPPVFASLFLTRRFGLIYMSHIIRLDAKQSAKGCATCTWRIVHTWTYVKYGVLFTQQTWSPNRLAAAHQCLQVFFRSGPNQEIWFNLHVPHHKTRC